MKSMMIKKKYNSGMSMVELMIAMVIGVILLGGAATMFMTNKRIYKEQAEMGLLQENARFALDLLADNIRMAGYVGCHDDFDNITNHLTTPGMNDFTDFIDGTQGANDSITIRYFQPFGVTTTADMGAPDSDIAINDGQGINENDVLAITDCANADIFLNTHDDTPGDMLIKHEQDAAGNTSDNLSKSYPTGSMINRVISRRYFIQDSSNGTGPALWWQHAGGSEELIEGVEKMEILFGEDTTGNGRPNSFANAGAITDWRDVVAVQVALLMRTVEEYGTIVDERQYDLLGTTYNPVDDRRRRRVFTTTIQIRNGMVEN
ncbi:MAG: PilW family protein [Gammaproteobacteria bacterium]